MTRHFATLTWVCSKGAQQRNGYYRQWLMKHDEAASYLKLKRLMRQFEADTRRHVHKENNVLFRRALGL
jgi:hemerythrin-like domain-containing protein